MGNKYFIVAGEHSGDLHASNLVKQIRAKDPSAVFSGAGGPMMKKNGVTLHYDLTAVSVIGFVEVLRHIRYFRKVFSSVAGIIRSERPDVVILVDYPGFNMRLAKVVKKMGIKVLYYISPQVWAWKRNRVVKMAEIADKLMVIFPFEKEYYEKTSLDVEFIGHPLVDILKERMKKEAFFDMLGFSPDRKLIGILPGSRENEVKKLLPVILRAARILYEEYGVKQYVIGCASKELEPIIRSEAEKSPVEIKISMDLTFDIMKHSDFVIASSGTATLQTGFFGTPMVIVYKVSWFTYFLGKKLIKIPYIGLANVVLEEKVVPELIQNDANPEEIAKQVSCIMANKDKYMEIKNKLGRIKELLGAPGASERAAEIAVNMAAR
ncbi:MAG: lipid-A-disaccharide synthase [Candidatus Aureabacteria bacterium]|nr:lipid-A-disaccharide synthase [Candidatus Auribacterota bacterium]